MICPLCGRDLDVQLPAYADGVRRFTTGGCRNTDCRVDVVTVEWITGAGRRMGKGHWAPGADQQAMTQAAQRPAQ